MSGSNVPELIFMSFQCDSEVEASSQHPAPSGSLWFLAYTRPKLEAVAAQNLQQQGFEAYLPLFKRLKKTDAEPLVIFEPMFPRYVFFRPAQLTQSIAPVRSTRGVATVVSFGHEIASVKPDILCAIRQLEEDRSALDVADLSSLRPGHLVRFRNPAFKGLEGLVKTVSSRRVAVLLELMGRQQLVSVDHHQLEAA